MPELEREFVEFCDTVTEIQILVLHDLCNKSKRRQRRAL